MDKRPMFGRASGLGAVALRVTLITVLFVIGASTPASRLANSVRDYGEDSVRAARISMALIILTNSVAFALTAFAIRRHWVPLALGRVGAGALLLGFFTFGLLWLASLFIPPYLAVLPSVFVWSVFFLPGVAVAQRLRFSAKHKPSS